MSKIELNDVISRHVVYNKQVEKRMAASSGGAFIALLETIVKDGWYFCGAVFTEDLHAEHIITNNPMRIEDIAGYKPVASSYTHIIPEIKERLKESIGVLFCGTPAQCNDVKVQTGNPDNLITVDIISSPFVSDQLLQGFKNDLEKQYESEVTNIRFYDKEFSFDQSKRILFKNGRVIYHYNEDCFDKLQSSGMFTPYDSQRDTYLDSHHRVGDITIGAYNMTKGNDGLGYTYLSVNSVKGDMLYKKALKRLLVIASDGDVSIDKIKYTKGKSSSNHQIITKPLATYCEFAEFNTVNKLKRFVAPLYRGLVIAKWNPITYARFLKLNYFSRSIKTDKLHNGLIYLTPYCALKLAKGFSMELHGPLLLGSSRIKESRQETRLRMEPGSKLIVRKACSFGAGSNIEIYRNALLDVGDLGSNAELTIICGQHIKIGATCNIARNATIRDTSGHVIAVPGFKMSRPVEIGNHTWICSEATIMPGVKIGDGSIIGSCSYVSKNVPPFTLVQGSPAEIVGNPKYFRI